MISVACGAGSSLISWPGTLTRSSPGRTGGGFAGRTWASSSQPTAVDYGPGSANVMLCERAQHILGDAGRSAAPSTETLSAPVPVQATASPALRRPSSNGERVASRVPRPAFLSRPVRTSAPLSAMPATSPGLDWPGRHWAVSRGRRHPVSQVPIPSGTAPGRRTCQRLKHGSSSGSQCRLRLTCVYSARESRSRSWKFLSIAAACGCSRR